MCYIAGISFFSKVNGYEDLSQTFVVKKVLEGIKRSKGNKKDNHLPITKDLLKVILRVVPVACSSQYEACMFGAAFSLAFHGLLRVSEIAVSNGLKRHVLLFSDISLGDDSLNVHITSSKTDQLGKGTVIMIKAQSDLSLCPCALVRRYIRVRPPVLGSFFCHYNGDSLTRYQFVAVLKKCLKIAGVNQFGFTSHSFRIGMATTLSLAGYPDSLIQSVGRWKSDAYKRYVRI